MKRIFIYDLDRTVIDSDHRVPYMKNGDLNLQLYYANKSMISNDTLLPLVNLMREQYKSGHKIVICTARVMDDRDYTYLHRNFIPHHLVMSRTLNDLSSDASLKFHLLSAILPNPTHNKLVPVVMYDDNESVLDMLPNLGIIGVNSMELNRSYHDKIY